MQNESLSMMGDEDDDANAGRILSYLGKGPLGIKEESLSADDLASMTSSGSSGMRMKGEKEKGTFWPERPTKADPSLAAAGVKANTVLTNLQRGNIPTMQTIVMEPVVHSLHQRAGMGELRPDEITPEMLVEEDHRGRPPLLWSSFYGQTPTVNLLLRSGADVNARGDEDETSLHLAATNGHHDVVRTLLTHGAQVDALDENSNTALMFAVMQNHPHAVNELLQAGADITKTNINGDTAISLSVKRKASQAQAVLEQHILSFMRNMTTEINTE